MKLIFAVLAAAVLLTACGREGALPEMNRNTEETIPVETTVSQTVTPEETHSALQPELLTALIEPEETDFVRVTDYVPDALVELKYATADNFTGQVIYEFEDVFLRYGTVVKLMAVREELKTLGYSLKIWDGFRPVSAQFRLWEVCPNDTYVADPNKGYSNHSRGFAVDVTMVDAQGREVEMPTGFDDFSSLADRDYSDCTEEAAKNARLLETVMEKHGFQGYWGEWWHFNDTRKYDVEDCFDPVAICRRQTAEDAVLLKRYYEPDSRILTVPEEESLTVLGYKEGWAMAEYWGYRGWINLESLD